MPERFGHGLVPTVPIEQRLSAIHWVSRSIDARCNKLLFNMRARVGKMPTDFRSASGFRSSVRAASQVFNSLGVNCDLDFSYHSLMALASMCVKGFEGVWLM